MADPLIGAEPAYDVDDEYRPEPEPIPEPPAWQDGSFRIGIHTSIAGDIAGALDSAAKLGANGILLHGVGDQAGGSVGAGISTETNSPHSPYGLGFGASAFFYQESGDGVAIYVESK